VTAKMPAQKITISEDQLTRLSNILLKFGLKKEISNGNQALEGIICAFETIFEQREKDFHPDKQEQEDTKQQLRFLKDENDEIKQRNLKGNVILNSPDIPSKNLHTIIKTDEALKKENKTIKDHAKELVREHYGIEIQDSDLAACHRLKGPGSILVKFNNRCNDSAYSSLVKAIKRGGLKGEERRNAKSKEEKSHIKLPNFFICFHLTKRRGMLVQHLKKLKRNGDINNFSSDQNGAIYMQVKRDGAWEPITRQFGDDESKCTLTEIEVDQLVKKVKKEAIKN
jgi:hypothetical protein